MGVVIKFESGRAVPFKVGERLRAPVVVGVSRQPVGQQPSESQADDDQIARWQQRMSCSTRPQADGSGSTRILFYFFEK